MKENKCDECKKWFLKGQDIGAKEEREKHLEEEKRTFEFARKLGQTDERSRIVKLIEGMKLEDFDGNNNVFDTHKTAHNIALTDLLTSINQEEIDK